MVKNDLTFLSVSVFSSICTSIIAASSLAWDPRLQEMVRQALPGRSQSYRQRTQNTHTHQVFHLYIINKKHISGQLISTHSIEHGLFRKKKRPRLTKTFLPEFVKNEKMVWKILSFSWGMMHGVGFLCHVQFPLPAAT